MPEIRHTVSESWISGRMSRVAGYRISVLVESRKKITTIISFSVPGYYLYWYWYQHTVPKVTNKLINFPIISGTVIHCTYSACRFKGRNKICYRYFTMQVRVNVPVWNAMLTIFHLKKQDRKCEGHIVYQPEDPS